MGLEKVFWDFDLLVVHGEMRIGVVVDDNFAVYWFLAFEGHADLVDDF